MGSDAVRDACALVTGGTSGIGLAVVRALAEAGVPVHLCARSADRVTETAKLLSDEGLPVSGSVCDVRSGDSVRELVNTAVESHGRIGVLVNNAGRNGGGVTASVTDEVWYDVIDTNLNSVFLVTREVLRSGRILAGADGRIINIASTGGKQGVVLGAPYSASKHGVVGFTKALGLELAASGTTVNAVCPGYVETPMADRVRQGYARLWETTTDDVLARFQKKIPMGRYATPEEVAGLVRYLASPAAAAVTAQAMNVCGGLGNY